MEITLLIILVLGILSFVVYNLYPHEIEENIDEYVTEDEIRESMNRLILKKSEDGFARLEILNPLKSRYPKKYHDLIEVILEEELQKNLTLKPKHLKVTNIGGTNIFSK